MKKLGSVVSSYYETRALIESDVAGLKKFFGSQKDMPGKTKADILKQIWKELPKHMDTPVPPLDDEMLTNLAKEPAIIEGEFKHSWGTASKLYKSEAMHMRTYDMKSLWLYPVKCGFPCQGKTIRGPKLLTTTFSDMDLSSNSTDAPPLLSLEPS